METPRPTTGWLAGADTGYETCTADGEAGRAQAMNPRNSLCYGQGELDRRQ